MLKTRIALLALASACSGFAVVGCSAEGPNADQSAEVDLQSVEFNLNVDGAEVSTVAYAVTDASGNTIKSGNFEIPLDDPSFSAQLLLPVGADYTLSISGTGTKDGRSIPCAGSAEFDVVAGTNPPISLTVTCTDTVVEGNTAPLTGEVRANIDFVLDTVIVPGEECGFTHGVVGPLMQLVGSNIDLKSMYIPATATTSWASSNAAVAAINNAGDDDTTATCLTAGTTVISTSLTSGTCTDVFSVEVTCVDPDAEPVVCGDGVVAAPETCDDGNTVSGDGCSATCIIEVPVELCGNGTVDAGEGCDDGNIVSGDGCSATCTVEAACGNGVLEAGEECDDDNTVSGDGCSATCVVEFCGDGTVNGTEECDDGNNAAGDGCSATCTDEPVELCGNGAVDAGEDCTTCPADVIAVNGPTACDTTTVNACTTCLENDPTMIANGIAQYQLSLCSNDPLCVAVQECLGRTDCFSREPNSLYFSDCFCGVGADQAACVSPSFVPAGACIPEITAAAGRALTNEEGATSLTDVNNFPSLGYGFLWVDYARQFGVCTNECGLDGTTNGVE
jgi:cysteine-rich repeat protein